MAKKKTQKTNKSVSKKAKTVQKAKPGKPIKKVASKPVKKTAKKITSKPKGKSNKTQSATKTMAASRAPKPTQAAKLTAFLKPTIAVGSLVPDFKVQSSSGKEVKLSDLKGQKVVLYFYPKDDTPGCTLEGQEFNKHLKEFADANTKVFGISRDSVVSHCKFIDKYGYQFELLSDADEMLCQLFDVIREKNMYGKIVMGIERSTFIIDENQVLIAEFRKIKAEGHAEQMLQFIKTH